MRLAQSSVRRPIFTIMIALIVIILGAVSLLRLPIDLMPDITYPSVSVSCAYENASPEEMEELVTRPMEEAVSAVPGVEEVTSVSVEGQSRVRIRFTWGTDLDAASNDVRDRLDAVLHHLPEDAERPTLRKFDLAAFPILVLGASSDMDPIKMRKIIEDQVKYRIERVPGVAALDIRGGLEREIHVDLDPGRLKALGLRLDEVLRRLREGNITLPAGTIQRGDLDVTIRTPGQFTSLREIAETVVGIRGGQSIRLREVAEVRDAWIKVVRSVRVNREAGLQLAVNKQSGKNTVEVAQGVLKELESLAKDLPQIRITPILDSSDYIKRSITNVGASAMQGGLLAILVLLLFLRNIRSTVIIATAIPLSIVATFVLMYFSGFTLNLMSLGGLALGVGMLVDNAIVVLENIYRLREEGRPAVAAAIDGTEEVTAAILASTLTTLVVFLPLIFVRGMAGVMFKQLSIVVSFALLASLAVALTLVPMLAGRILPPQIAGAKESLGHRIYRLTGGFFTWMEDAYRRLLGWSLDHRVIVVTATLLLLGASLVLIPFIGAELMPATDEREVLIGAELAVGTRLEVLDHRVRAIEEIAAATVPEIKNMVTRLGSSPWGSSGPHTSETRLSLKPLSEGGRSSEQIAADLRGALRDVPGMVIRTRAGQGLMSILRMGVSSQDKIQVEIRGHDMATAEALAKEVARVVKGVPGVTDTQISRESGSPEELILINRRKAEDMRLSVSDVANLLQTALSGTVDSYYREAGDEYGIRVQLRDAERMQLRDVLDLTLTNSDGEPVVLRNVVDVQPRSGPVWIERKNQERLVTVAANFTGRDMGSILADIRRDLQGVPVPEEFSISFGGDYEEQQRSFWELIMSCGLALVLVYMVMACQYESLRDPFVVMFSVPLAIIGVTTVLFFTGTTFNIQSFIGCIMLGGIVVNNAILLVDHTNLLRRRDGMALRAAIEEAGRRRLRPILMTALTTILGLLPLAIGLGEGGEAQAPLARVVIGGLTSSTFITLVIVPVVYSIFERKAVGVGAQSAAEPAPGAKAPPGPAKAAAEC